MSPWEVVAWMSSSAVPSFLRALLMRPWAVPASTEAETPAAALTEMSPDRVRSTTVPRTASTIRISPRAVLIDRGLLCSLHVAALGGVRGQDLDRGVGPAGGDELHAPRRDVQDGGDRRLGVELLHYALPVTRRF